MVLHLDKDWLIEFAMISEGFVGIGGCWQAVCACVVVGMGCAGFSQSTALHGQPQCMIFFPTSLPHLSPSATSFSSIVLLPFILLHHPLSSTLFTPSSS